MDSVRYHSYHQWKASKADTNKTSTYHEKLLTNVEALEGNVNQIDKLIAGYLDATKAFCGAGSQLAEAFSTVLNETPLLELPQQLKQVVEEVDHVAHKSSVHITNHILATLCEFTATLPGLRRAIEAHKRSVQNYESCQENLQLLEKDATLPSDGKRVKTARTRFRSATEELATEEERLYRSFTEVEENRVKMLGSCFLSLLQVQSQFMSSAADLMSPLGGFREIGDYLRDREVTLALKDATSTWLSLAQANQALRQGQGLSRQDTKRLTWGELYDAEKKKLVHCVETLLKNYKKEFERAPTPTADIPAGFHKNAKGIELALQGCCTDLERVAAGGLVDPQSRDEMEAQILRKIPKLVLKLGHVVTETCQSPSKANDNFKSKMHCIRELVSSVAKQNDIPLNKGNLDMFVLLVLHEACSPIASSTAQIAVQLLFGKANLVIVKPSSDNSTRQAHVYIKGTSVHVEVSTAWIITEDKTTFASIANDLDVSSPLGIVDAVYTAKFSLMDYLEDKERPLPTIHIKRQAPPQSPQISSGKEASPAHKHKGFRKSFSKATSKIFSRKSSSLKAGNGNVAAVPDVTNLDEPVSGAGAGNELTGVRTSVASSTDTSNDHEADTNFESPVPLPPPRPKHWARKVSTQNRTNETKDAVKEDGEKDQETKASDEWYNSEPKLPLPLFIPTMQGAESFMSLASQEELDEVINFLSGAPLSLATCAEDKFAEGSHMTPIDSGMGSLLSVPTSSFSISRANGSTVSTPVPQVHISAAGSDPSIQTTTASTQAARETRAQSPESETVETQTSSTEEIAPVGFDGEQSTVAAAARDVSPETVSPKGGATRPSEACSADTEISSDSVASMEEEEERSRTESPSDEGRETSQESPAVAGDSAGDVQTAAACQRTTQSSAENETSSPSLSPVLLTVSATEDSGEKKVSIVDSLRNVWLKAEPESVEGTTEELPGKLKERSGSHETLYHSCWSLSDFSEKPANKEDGKEDTKSLNESLLQSDTAAQPLDLGLKWSNFGCNAVWDNNPNGQALQTGCWRRSDEALNSRVAEVSRNNAFSLGLGITGPELFAAARGTSLDAIPVESVSQLPMHKPWSTEDLAQKDPWSSREVSPPLLWSKAHSLSQDARRPGQARATFLPQHHSEPYLPNERWWSPGGAPPPPAGHAHPVYQRYHSHLQRQYALDGTYQGVPAGAHRVHGGVFVQSAFQPVHQVYTKAPNQSRQLHVPPQYGLGRGNHHGSNPRF